MTRSNQQRRYVKPLQETTSVFLDFNLNTVNFLWPCLGHSKRRMNHRWSCDSRQGPGDVVYWHSFPLPLPWVNSRYLGGRMPENYLVSVMLWMQKHYLPDHCSSVYTDVAASYWEQEHGQEVTCIRSQSNHDLKRSCWLLATSAGMCVHLYKGFAFKNKQALKKTP